MLEQRASRPSQLASEQSSLGNSSWFPLASQLDLKDGLDRAEANALALFYSPKIATMRAERDIVGSQLIAAGLLPNPELFLGPRISTNDQSLIFPASLSFPISIFGLRSATQAVAKAQFERAELEVMLGELQILEDVTAGFIKLVVARNEVRIREENLHSYGSLIRWIESLFESGSADNMTLFLARAERDKTAAANERALLEVAARESELLALIGLLPSVTFSPLKLANLQQPIDLDSEPDNAKHPRLLAAKSNYQIAEQSMHLEVANQYPEIRLGFEGESDDGDVSLGFGLGSTIPIFNLNKTGIATARSRLLIAREEYRAAMLGLAHGRALARAEAEMNQRLLKHLREQRLSGLEAARAALENRLTAQDGNVLEALSATAALSDARVEEIKLEGELLLARLKEAIYSGAAFEQVQPREARHE